jgi:hypothetical protein
MNLSPEAQTKMTRLYLKMIAGIIYTDKEALPEYYIIAYAEKICNDVGEATNGYNILTGMIKMDILKISDTLHGDNFYTHTLPKTIQVNYHAANHYRTP